MTPRWLSSRPDRLNFAAGAAVGSALWLLSMPLLGVDEPWDTDEPVYSLTLLAAGLLLGLITGRALWAGYLGVWLGQMIAAAILQFPVHGLHLLAVTSGIGSILFLIGLASGALLKWLIDRRGTSRRARQPSEPRRP